MNLSMRTVATALLLALAGADAAHERVWSPSFPTAHAIVPLYRVREAPSAWGLCGELDIGSPPQRFRVVFESTDTLTWVRSTSYDHTRSNSYEPDGRKAGEVGAFYFIEGFQSRDTLRFSAPPVLANATFIEATKVTNPASFPQLPPVDGVFGFSPALLVNMVLRQIVYTLDKPVVTLYLSKQAQSADWRDTDTMARGSDGVKWEGVGELVIGAIDSRRFTGDIHYVNTKTSDAWVVALDGVTVASNTVRENLVDPSKPESAYASVWPSYPLILGPPEVVDKLAKAAGADGDGIDCSSPGPDIEFHLGGRKFVFSKADYALPSDDISSYKRCRWAFVGANSSTWLLGQPFLRKFYTVFTFGTEDESKSPSIGFALAV